LRNSQKESAHPDFETPVDQMSVEARGKREVWRKEQVIEAAKSPNRIMPNTHTASLS